MFCDIFLIVKLPYKAKNKDKQRINYIDMSEKFNQNKYINEYARNNYDRINMLFKKGTKDKLQEHCKKYGYKSISSFVNDAINEKIARDLENF